MGPTLLLAVCSGGNDTLAAVIMLGALLCWLLAIGLTLVKAQGGTERIILGCILLGSVVLGGLTMSLQIGVSGPNGYLLPLFVAPLVAAAAGLTVAQATGRVDLGRALLASLVGGASLPWGWLILFYASVAIGSGCIGD